MTVERLEVEAAAYGEGAAYGAAGAYESLKGLAHFAVDPGDPVDLRVTDLALAVRDADGKVRFDADIEILRPVNPARRNRRLVLDVVNRGNPILRLVGEPWLLAQGFTVVRCGWQHDVRRGGGLFGIGRVETAIDGAPVVGTMSRVFEPDAPSDVFVLGEPGVVPYRANPERAGEATLSERDYPGGPPRAIPRDAWRFARRDGETTVEDFASVFYEAGFVPGRAYEVIFEAKGAPLTGHGLAAARDLVAFLRFASAAEGNPLAGEIDLALALGVSQTGRFLRQMLYDGFCEDGGGRLIFEGLLPHTGGARLLETNWRFGQPVYNGWDAVTAAFPFTDAVQTDPETGIADGLLARAMQSGRVPKIVYTNSSAEYWGGQAGSLAHVTADGLGDAETPDNVRIYALAGTQHGVAPLEGAPGGRSARGAYPANTIDYGPLLRAAFHSLDRWVSDGTAPPPSRYGRLDDGTLVGRDELAHTLAWLPGPGAPTRLAELRRMDFGPTARETRRMERVPPAMGALLALHVSAVDDDGNEVAGVRHPEIAAPLATYTGWNPRHPDIGGPDQNLRTAGSTIRFARTREEREAAGDPRPSIAERYASRDAYVAAVRAAAEALAADGYLLAEDIDGVAVHAARRYSLYTAG